MEHITLNNGVKIPMLGLGTWDLRGQECEGSVREAIEIGYRLIDTAQMYENERMVGNAVRACGVSREDLFITTKIYRPDTTYQKAKEAIERSLRELQTDYIDLLLIHEPYHESPEMYRAMEEAYEKGRLRAIGVSNFNVAFYIDFIRHCSIIPAVNQVETHIFFQRETLRQTLELHGTHMEAWSPFATVKKNIFTNQLLTSIGRKYGKSPAQIALKFLVQSRIAVIPKSSHSNRLIENMNIFDFNLSVEDINVIKEMDQGKSLFGWYEP